MIQEYDPEKEQERTVGVLINGAEVGTATVSNGDFSSIDIEWSRVDSTPIHGSYTHAAFTEND